MAKVRSRPETGKLYFDFTYMGVRFKEYTALIANAKNLRQAEGLARRIQAEIDSGIFSYEKFFPSSRNLQKVSGLVLQKERQEFRRERIRQGLDPHTPKLADFTEVWLAENEVRWRKSTRVFMNRHAYQFIVPEFGERVVSEITRAEILAFRSKLAKVPARTAKGVLSARTINAHMMVLKTLLSEAAARYQFMTPVSRIPSLKTRRTAVEPFTLDEARSIIETIPELYRYYVTVRFFTGMRTSEVDGLLWKNIDWKRKQILVETSATDDEGLKTTESQRAISMNGLVYDALMKQREMTKQISKTVFCNQEGNPIDGANFTKRAWAQTLAKLCLEYRRPYQMRHTAATLWLASGEAPEWIARQLGHANTQMLFKTYSRYIPNLTRRDGAAFENLLASNGFTKTMHIGVLESEA